MRSTYLCPQPSDWITDVFFILDVWTKVLVLVRQAPHWLSLFCRPHIKIILMEQISLCCLKSHHFYPQLIRTSSYIISSEVYLLNRLSSVLEFLAICLKSDKGIFFFCIESQSLLNVLNNLGFLQESDMQVLSNSHMWLICFWHLHSVPRRYVTLQ